MSQTIDHANRKHALLGASASARWLKCTPSPRLEEKSGVGESTSVYAEEGTLAHEFGDIGLQFRYGLIDEEQHKILAEPFREHELYTKEMEPQVEKYIDYVMEQFNVANQINGDAVLKIEEKIDLRHLIPEGKGINDAIIVADGIMEVSDLKYGKGIKVYAEENSQLMLYGIGALHVQELLYDIHTVRLTIIQPRLDHISSWDISVKDLKKWAEEVVRPKAIEAWEGKGNAVAGSWCQWCKIKHNCKALAESNLKAAQDEFGDVRPKTDTSFLTNEELLKIFEKMPQIAVWIKAVKEHLMKEALSGATLDGYKLVRGKSNRTWTDTEEILKILKRRKYKNADILSTPKLLGIGAIETLIGKAKFPKVLGEYVHKPEGAPTLVKESDKRPAIDFGSAETDFEKDFKE